MKSINKYWLLILVLAFIPGYAIDTHHQNRAEKIVAEIHNPHSRRVLVISHRGDWRNYPENSIPAIESVIRMGVDIMELDLKLTKDSVIVLSHDKTLDRTTNGKGNISDWYYSDIEKLCLKRAHGVVTDSVRMPTLKQALLTCKDRIVVNIDQGYEYYDLVLRITEELGVTDQILIKGKRPAKDVEEKLAVHKKNMMYMPIIDIQKSQGRKLFDEYIDNNIVPLAYEFCWDKMTPEVKVSLMRAKSQGAKIWVNTLWGSLCGGLDDDAALEKGTCVYQNVLDLGATMIQTDRPELLIKFLHKKGLHK
jgi:glycerophosphoryl diester phosphodiesterase